MTDRTPPPSGPSGPDVGSGVLDDERRDEIASAYLDGMATPAEIELVESDDGLIDIVGRFAGIERVVDNVGPPPGPVLDAAVGAALAEFDAAPPTVAADADDADASEPDTAGATPGADATVTALGSHRRQWWTRVPLGAVAAVVVAIALVGVAGLAGTGDDDDETATAATEAAEDRSFVESMESADDSGDAAMDEAEMDAGALDDSVAALPAADSDVPTGGDGSNGGSEPRLRIFESEDELVDLYRQRFAGGAGAATSDTGDDGTDEASTAGTGDDAAEESDQDIGVDPCDSVRVLGFDDDPIVTVERVSIDGRNGTAVVAGTDTELRLGVVADEDCTIVLLDDI